MLLTSSCEIAPNSNPASSRIYRPDFIAKIRIVQGSKKAQIATLRKSGKEQLNQTLEHAGAWGYCSARFHTYSLLGETDGAIKLPEICLKQFGTDMKQWIKNDSRSHPGSSGNRTLLAPY